MPLEALQTLEGPEQDYLWTLNFGPQHPATHTTLRLVLTLDGETVVKAVPDIGFLHSGFEKLGEDLDFNQYVTIVDRMNYISPINNEIAWHHVVETLMGIEITPRCKYVRTILSELSRISDHLLCTGAQALDLGAFTAFLYGFYQREVLYDIFETVSGQRFHPSYTRVGGLLFDVKDDFIRKVRAFVKDFPKTHADMCRLLNRNRIFLERTQDIGILTKEMAIDLGCTGPVARASGVVRDLRKDEPKLAYPELQGAFKVVCMTEGDCYARYLVRMEEMLESLKIIDAAIENLPAGPVNVDVNSKVVFPEPRAVYRTIEGLIQQFELVMPNRQWTPPVDEVYGAMESPNGELGFYLISDGTGVAYRARTRPPSYIHFAVFPYLIEGHQISDVVAVLGSLNIIAAEFGSMNPWGSEYLTPGLEENGMAALSEEIRQQILAYIPRYPNKQAVTLPALHIVHDAMRCVSHEAVREIADMLDLSPAQVQDTMTFYQFFREENAPLGQTRVWVCRSLACGLRGGEELLDTFCQKLNVKPGGTTKDGKITLEFAECIGACEGAPAVMVNDEHRHCVTAEKVDELLRELQ